MNSNNDLKRWVAVGIAVVIFIISTISTSISGMISHSEKQNEFPIPSKFSSFLSSDMLKESVIKGTNSNERILILKIKGVISQGQTSMYGSNSYNHSGTLAQLENAKQDETIKGIVLAVDSPGGGVYESAQLYDKIMELKALRDIPIYTSMGSVAASGGYYIAAATDKIYASTETVTGSIGVIMRSTNYSQLFEKLGLKDNTVKSGKYKDLGSGSRPATDDDIAIMQEFINSSYSRFVQVVAKGRKMSEEKVRQIADGRIYDGAQALSIGLIDEIGYEEEVIQAMTDALGLVDPLVFEISEPKFSHLTDLLTFKSSKSQLKDLQSLVDAYSAPSSPKPMYLYGGN